jgi:hypothetical protein
MSKAVRVFVNASLIDLPPDAVVRDAVRAADPSLSDMLSTGAAYVTDGRGIQIDPSSPLMNGAILRVVVPAKGRSTDANP